MTVPDREPTSCLPPAAAVRPPLIGRWLRRGAAAALAVACGGAHAAPDAVSRFLAEHGLAAGDDAAQAPPRDAAAPPGLLDQVRSTASELVVAAMNFLGVPYRFGGSSQDEGFDCSGFTRHVFALALGLTLPRRSDQQATASGLIDIGRDDLAPGDLVFFNTLRHAFSHVGIYVGGGKFIHAPRSGSEVRIEDMRSSYWARRFDGARRPRAATVSGTS
jgi:cell wall-associated NlpC family hydrolase